MAETGKSVGLEEGIEAGKKIANKQRCRHVQRQAGRQILVLEAVIEAYRRRIDKGRLVQRGRQRGRQPLKRVE